MKNVSHRSQAALVAALLLATGMASGIIVDRTLLAPQSANATALTFESLSERIDLSAEESARVRAVLDSVHTQVMAASGRGPGAMRAAAEAAHVRIEASLPPEARAGFRTWLEEHREHMMRRMHTEMTGR